MFLVFLIDTETVSEYDFKAIHQYRQSEIVEEDRKIEMFARSLKDVYYEEMYQTGWISGVIDDERTVPLPDIADEFAKIYWQKDSLSQVSDYLSDQYGEYSIDSSNTTVAQLDAIMIFYGFPTADQTRYDKNPYTGEVIWDYSDHIAFLIDGYHQLEETVLRG